MRLKKLVLENYQGIKKLLYEGDGDGIELRGDNDTGKTTFGNSIAFLLYGKPITGEKSYTPKTQKDGEEIHFLIHSAEGTFIQDDGSQLVLKKELQENWVKQKGTNEKSFKGNPIQHYLDGVPVSEKAYKDRLDAICNIEQTKMLTSPTYFSEDLEWQKRRELLLELCGDIADSDVISNKKELKPLLEYLKKPGTTDQYYTVDEFLKIGKAKLKQINEELQNLPSRIDEVTRAMPNIKGLNVYIINAQIAEKNAAKAKIQADMANIESTATAVLQAQQQNLKLQLAQAETAHTEELNVKNKMVTNEIAGKITKKIELEQEATKATIKSNNLKMKIEVMNNQRAKLFEEYQKIAAEQYTGDTICPTCGQTIPAEKIEQAMAMFNLSKSKKLEELNEKGKKECSKEMIQELEEQQKECDTMNQQLKEQIASFEEQEKQLKARVETVAFNSTKKYNDLTLLIKDIDLKLANESNNASAAREELKRQINALDEEIKELGNKIYDITNAANLNKRIEELKVRETELSAEFDKIDRGMWLCQEFTKTKAAMLTDIINEQFVQVRFMLFKPQVDGQIIDTCEVLVPTKAGLINFKSANNASRINAGVEIIDKLAQHWNVTMPIILDNAESVTKPKQTNAQTIRLIVDERYEELTLISNGTLEISK
jgi:ribosomal protein S17E